MPKTFEFEGQHYDFPDDVSDDEALKFLGSQHPKPLSPSDKLSKFSSALSLGATPNLPEPPPPSMFERAGNALSSGFDTAMGAFGKPKELVQSGVAKVLSYAPMATPEGKAELQSKMQDVVERKRTLGSIAREPFDKLASGATGVPFVDDLMNSGAATFEGAKHGAAMAGGITDLGVEMVSDPLTYGLVGALKKAGLVGNGLTKAISLGFAISMGENVPTEFAHVKEIYEKEGWSPKATGALTDAILHTGMAGLAAAHATTPGKPAPSLPKAPGTLESVVRENTPLDRTVAEVTPELPVPEGTSFATEGPELQKRIRAAQAEVKGVEREERSLARQAENERFKAAQLEVEALEKSERAAAQAQKSQERLEREAEVARFKEAREQTSELEAAEREASSDQTAAYAQEAKLRDQIERAQFAEEQRRVAEAARAQSQGFSQEARLTDQIEKAQAAEEVQRRKDAETFPNPVGSEPRVPNLPEPPSEALGNELGGSAEAGRSGEGALGRELPTPPSEVVPSGQTVSGPGLPGAPVEGQALVQPRGATGGETTGSAGATEGTEALEAPKAGSFRRSALTDNEQMAAAAAVNDLAPGASRAEILGRLSQGDMPIKLRPAGSRIQKVASEVERMLKDKAEAKPSLPEAPDLTEVQESPALTELPRPPKTLAERMAEKEAKLKQELDTPVAREEEFIEEGNVAEGTPEELASALERHLKPLQPGQDTPTQFDQPRISEDAAARARAEAESTPAYRKASGVANKIRQLWGEGTQAFRPIFDVAKNSKGETLPVRGYTSQQGRGVGSNLHTLARDAVRKAGAGGDVVDAFVKEIIANQAHEVLHDLAKDTAHTDKLSSDLSRSQARSWLETMKNEKGQSIFSPEELNRLVPEGADKLSQGEKHSYLSGLMDKVAGGALDGLVESLKKGLSPEDVHALNDSYGRLAEGLKAEKTGEASPLAEASELPKAPDKRISERGAVATDLPKVLGQAALKGLKKSGNLAARTQMANLAGGLYTVLNNTVNAGGKVAAHELSDAIWGALDSKSEGKSRAKARFNSVGDLVSDAVDTFKLKFQREPTLSESGKELEALRKFGRKHLPRLTDQTFGQFAGEAAHLGGESAKGPVEAKVDAGLHMTMLPALVSERALTANQIKTSMSALMKREGTDLRGLIARAEVNPKLKQELTNVYARAAGEANAMRFGRNAFVQKGSPNWGEAAVQLWNKTPGWAQVGVSNLIGTPFVKAVVANAFTDFVEFMPGINQMSKRVRTAPELTRLEEKSLAGTLDKEGKRRLRELQENGPYGRDFIRGQQMIGPMALAVGLTAGIYASSKGQPGTIETGKDEGGTKRKGVVGALGSANPWYALGEYIGRAYKGDDPRFLPSTGKVAGATTSLAGDLTQQRGGQSTLGELIKAATGDGTEQEKLRKLVDKYMSDLGRTAVPAVIGDFSEAGQPEKRPDLPVKGETPGVDAFGRGVASRVGLGVREGVTSAIDPTTGETKKAGNLPGFGEFPARERYVSRLSEFLEAHKGQMEGGAFTLRQHGLESFDKNQFEFWKKGLKDEDRVVVGRKPSGELKRLSIDTLLRDDSIPDRVKAELLQDALPALVKESTNFATREALKESKASGKPPEVPSEAMIRELRKAEEEKILRDYGVPSARRRKLPPSSRGMTKPERRQFQESLPEAPAP